MQLLFAVRRQNNQRIFASSLSFPGINPQKFSKEAKIKYKEIAGERFRLLQMKSPV